MGVEIDVEYQGDLHCEAGHGPSGVTLTTDAPTDNGGRGESFSPTDLVAAALGTCLATIMGLVASRHGLDIRGTKVHVVKEMVDQPFRRIGSLKTTISIPNGSKLSAADRTRLEQGARHCPVHKSLHPDVHAPLEFIYL